MGRQLSNASVYCMKLQIQWNYLYNKQVAISKNPKKIQILSVTCVVLHNITQGLTLGHDVAIVMYM